MPSDSTATLSGPAPTKPMNFNVIGATGGGPGTTGGPVTTGGGCGGRGGAGGGAFGFTRNKLRSAPCGFGCSPFNCSRCTSGAAVVCIALSPRRAVRPLPLDVETGPGDVCVQL